MRNNLKRLVSFLLAFVLMVGLLPMQVFASSWHTTPWEERTDNVYSSNWKNWSQGASQYYCMAKYGCHIVSQSKMLREAGIVGGTFNPDVFHRWMLNNKGYDGGAKSLNEHSPCNEQVIRYIKANDSTASLRKVYLNDSNLSAQDRISMLQKYVNQDCYIVLGRYRTPGLCSAGRIEKEGTSRGLLYTKRRQHSADPVLSGRRGWYRADHIRRLQKER